MNTVAYGVLNLSTQYERTKLRSQALNVASAAEKGTNILSFEILNLILEWIDNKQNQITDDIRKNQTYQFLETFRLTKKRFQKR